MNITDSIEKQIRKDIDDWSINFVETSNKFYGYRFPVCPYARQARLSGESLKHVYSGGSVRKFIKEKVYDLANDKKHTVMMLIFPSRVKWHFGLHKFLINLNKEIIPLDLYALEGSAMGTVSSFPGFFNSGEYFLVGVNTLSNVLPAVKALTNAGYYKDWTAQHYDEVVTRRQQMYEKYTMKERNK